MHLFLNYNLCSQFLEFIVHYTYEKSIVEHFRIKPKKGILKLFQGKHLRLVS